MTDGREFFDSNIVSSCHVEAVSLLQKMSNTRERTITLDVEMEDYYRLKNETEKAQLETQPEVELLEINL